MKKVFLTFIIAFLFSTVQAQEKGKQTISVKGNCEMCKKRIEKAALDVKGVRSAEWSAEKQAIDLYINPKKTNTKEVEKAIAKAGHDTEHITAEDEAYQSLHSCCQYSR
ncbi:heavy-metal-associated domain-containing protein [Myroides indicus]|uniref:Copper chaperone CopZ n=1 Tax=Myroides indicus TaxID=1323422 RepID=A0A4R7ENQ3_9FLAO|nr:heavy-metal-associated domain-containing protein [Myroides indicus]TDS52732.1 copper chaperone CopZ [Myroides indicus]